MGGREGGRWGHPELLGEVHMTQGAARRPRTFMIDQSVEPSHEQEE